jgi:cell division protein FtsB
MSQELEVENARLRRKIRKLEREIERMVADAAREEIRRYREATCPIMKEVY